jgi:hypothetical protein
LVDAVGAASASYPFVLADAKEIVAEPVKVRRLYTTNEYIDGPRAFPPSETMPDFTEQLMEITRRPTVRPPERRLGGGRMATNAEDQTTGFRHRGLDRQQSAVARQ